MMQVRYICDTNIFLVINNLLEILNMRKFMFFEKRKIERLSEKAALCFLSPIYKWYSRIVKVPFKAT